MSWTLDERVKELREAQKRYSSDYEQACEFDDTDYIAAVEEHMPAILDALERVTRERDEAQAVVEAAIEETKAETVCGPEDAELIAYRWKRRAAVRDLGQQESNDA